MGSLWRSEPMVLIQLLVQREAAHDTAEELGVLGMCQFKDLQSGVNAFQRTFAEDVKRCDELERKLRYFDENLKSAGTKVRPGPEEAYALNDLENELEKVEADLKEVNENEAALERDRNKLIEFKHVLMQDARFFDVRVHETTGTIDVGGSGYEEEERRLLDSSGFGASATESVGFVTGVIPRDKLHTYERVLLRATRGNVLLRHVEIEQPVEDPITGEKVKKNVFIVFYHGEHSRSKVQKISESFGANVYSYPADPADARRVSQQVDKRIEEQEDVIARTVEQKQKLLHKIGKQFPWWKRFIGREKGIFHTLNMWEFTPGSQRVTAECWSPKNAVNAIDDALRRAERKSSSESPSILRHLSPGRETPPTHFNLGSITGGFQQIVDSYGIARYQEINPGVYTIITFPFLFAIMFGDAGHGTLMSIIAFYMLINQDKLKQQNLGEIFGILFDGRYVLTLMGLFSMYTGIMYNDWFSLAFDWFGTGYTKSGTKYYYDGEAYPIGVDPVWYGKGNKLIFYNSLKMKLSVILGVTQMVAGILLSLLNHFHFKNWLNVFFQFIPEIIFMMSTFGYMVITIFVKWATNYTSAPGSAPSLLAMMTDYFLKPGTIKTQLYAGQGSIQTILLLLAFLSVPVLLCVKPCILKRRHKREERRKQRERFYNNRAHAADAVDSTEIVAEVDEEEEFDFGEIMIHQIIHTIEFVLGAVSHTASYLRLWALSLAHAELSEVFWEYVMELTVGMDSTGIMTFVGFAIWAFLTFAVLLCMEALSAFLHALRLHWVEFQSKFYAGDGIKFVPFNLATVE